MLRRNLAGIELTSEVERQAVAAEELAAFSGVKLLHVKQRVAEILGLIGRGEIFDEYTKHDISHIDKMLAVLDEWMIPAATRDVMSPADWLMVVLAVYFHDLGLLVTKQEFAERDASGFPEFCRDFLFRDDEGEDYRTRVEALGEARAQRFLYQEFVRFHHAARVKAWINGTSAPHLGIAPVAATEVKSLLEPLPPQFRRDLALVCESHHLDDLSDFQKYQVSQPYGDSDAETANVHYAAIVLRASDLLHITSDRAPSIAYRLIDPSDPVSQEEWAKQLAVTRLRPQLGKGKDGLPDEDAPKDTVEVHAFFEAPTGFFALTAYLSYAADQLRRCWEWTHTANERHATRHLFPWRYLDDHHIETQGFLRDAFEFTLDQAKILDLLTGHTLYNDTGVVLRELVQNSLDAVRLQELQTQDEYQGHVRIEWNTAARKITVVDNGVGMTQSVIENHLLKVGASLYQEPEFQKQFPGFSPISRFGIGVLSTFMVADEVTVTTCSVHEDLARQLSLRSVHGRYLIELLPKDAAPVDKLCPHGTRVTLRVRPSAEIADVLNTVRRWVVLPGCEVTVAIDGGDEVKVGFATPREAVEAGLTQSGFDLDASSPSGRRLRVDEAVQGGVTLAYAVEWSEYFQEWSLLSTRDPSVEQNVGIGTCVEGIRVEETTPGFDGLRLYALANARGASAPKTNVARVGLEATPERHALLDAVYRLFTSQVEHEITDLHERRAFSLTWAVQESRWLIGPLLTSRASRGGTPTDRQLLHAALARLPTLLVEEGGERKAMSPEALSQEAAFWMVESAFFRSAEGLLRELPVNASLSQLTSVLTEAQQELALPDGTVLCNTYLSNAIDGVAFSGKEVQAIHARRDERRVDVKWAMASDPPTWATLVPSGPLVGRLHSIAAFGYKEPDTIHVQRHDVELVGLTSETFVKTFESWYLLAGNPLHDYAMKLLARLDEQARGPDRDIAQTVASYLFDALAERGGPSNAQGFVDRQLDQIAPALPEGISAELRDLFDLDALYLAIEDTDWRVLNTAAWRRRSDSLLKQMDI